MSKIENNKLDRIKQVCWDSILFCWNKVDILWKYWFLDDWRDEIRWALNKIHVSKDFLQTLGLWKEDWF